MKSSSAACSRLLRLITELGEQERVILTRVAERLKAGQDRYGRFDLTRDSRNFDSEAECELLDWLVYREASKIQKG